MTTKTLVASVIATAVLVVGTPALAGSSADSLSLHERDALWTMFYSRMGCVDQPPGHCVYTPARMKFASDYGQRSGARVAYAVVTYSDFDRNGSQTGKRGAMLFMFDTPTVGGGARWKYVAQSSDGRFLCGTEVLDNPNFRIDQQIRVLKRVVRCM